MITDLVLLSIFFIFGIFGIKKGFIQSLFGLLGSLVALILAFVFASTFADILLDTFVGDFINGISISMINVLGDVVNTPLPTIESLRELMGTVFPEFLVDAIFGASNSGMVGQITIAEYVTPLLTSFLLTIVSFIIVFILFKILFVAVKYFVDAITSLPILKQMNKLLGFFMGILKALIFIYIMFSVLSLFQTLELFQPIFKGIEDSYLTKFMYNNNVILMLLSSLFN